MVLNQKVEQISLEENKMIKILESRLDSTILTNSREGITNHALAIVGCPNLRVLKEIHKMYNPNYQVKIRYGETSAYILLTPRVEIDSSIEKSHGGGIKSNYDQIDGRENVNHCPQCRKQKEQEEAERKKRIFDLGDRLLSIVTGD